MKRVRVMLQHLTHPANPFISSFDCDEALVITKIVDENGTGMFRADFHNGEVDPPTAGETFLYWFTLTKIVAERFPVGDLRRKYLEAILGEVREAWRQ